MGKSLFFLFSGSLTVHDDYMRVKEQYATIEAQEDTHRPLAKMKADRYFS